MAGSWFHCLQATSQALQPMQRVESVKNPTAWPGWNATGADGAPVEVNGWTGSGPGEGSGAGAAAGEGEGAGDGDGGGCWSTGMLNRLIAERSLSLLDVDHQRFALVHRHVGIADEGGQIVDDVAGRDPHVAPMPGEAHVVDLLAV